MNSRFLELKLMSNQFETLVFTVHTILGFYVGWMRGMFVCDNSLSPFIIRLMCPSMLDRNACQCMAPKEGTSIENWHTRVGSKYLLRGNFYLSLWIFWTLYLVNMLLIIIFVHPRRGFKLQNCAINCTLFYFISNVGILLFCPCGIGVEVLACCRLVP